VKCGRLYSQKEPVIRSVRKIEDTTGESVRLGTPLGTRGDRCTSVLWNLRRREIGRCAGSTEVYHHGR
jgi:hypothetical protein